MTDITIITGLASLFGCVCMAAVCTAQLRDLFAAARPGQPQPWEAEFCTPRARSARVTITPASRFAPCPATA